SAAEPAPREADGGAVRPGLRVERLYLADEVQAAVERRLRAEIELERSGAGRVVRRGRGRARMQLGEPHEDAVLHGQGAVLAAPGAAHRLDETDQRLACGVARRARLDRQQRLAREPAAVVLLDGDEEPAPLAQRLCL